MIAVIFEVKVDPEHEDQYLEIAETLSIALNGIDGFIGIERFRSLSVTGKLLSLSYWESEEAVANWRNLGVHRAAQTLGRSEVFTDYTLRVAEVRRSYGKLDRCEAPTDSLIVHG